MRTGHGLALLIRAADRNGLVRRLADLDTTAITESRLSIPSAGGALVARVYAPVDAPRYAVLLIPGLHPGGIDESRFVRLSRTFAEARVTVVTPELPALGAFEITPRLTDQIEAAATWLALRSGLARDGRIGLMGVSFSGGLAVVAAGRPGLRHHLRYVFALGGHDDLGRVLKYVCTGPEDPLGSCLQPHDYGLAVVLLNVAEQAVPPAQVAPLRAALRHFLNASYLDRIDAAAAEREYASARAFESILAEPAATLLRLVNRRDVTQLGRRLAPLMATLAHDPALSPSRAATPVAPVFLLHGRTDSVIPADESRHLAARLREQAEVHLLITDVLTHVDTAGSIGVVEAATLARFWGEMLAR